ncbi:MAG: three-Cys-motif partner protein TcmP [Thermoproteota archaeon]|jgi:three-Cys-motif partner protein
MLKFHEDAIVLSGISGTKIKCQIIGEYYPFWWNITSGGSRKNYSIPTAIVEMNAATGEDYIEETDETILGSAGHALQLKLENQNTSKLKLVLVEENNECFQHLKNVIKKRWIKNISNEEQLYNKLNDSGIYLLNTNVTKAVEEIEKMKLGIALFFFDPLLFTPWPDIEKVAQKRIRTFYKTGTEFIVFLFTSDWFLGRGDLRPLPTTNDQEKWSSEQEATVQKVDELFGHNNWRSELLCDKNVEDKMRIMVALYKNRLHKWFRYVLPLPFVPKPGQMYHLFVCSNYEVGVRVVRDFYAKYTKNPKYHPDNKKAYNKFKAQYPKKVKGIKQSKRPIEWKILWRIITSHEEGICDEECKDFKNFFKVEKSKNVKEVLDWLCSEGFLEKLNNFTDAWPEPKPTVYQLNWNNIRDKLDILPPQQYRPLSPEDIEAETNRSKNKL